MAERLIDGKTPDYQPGSLSTPNLQNPRTHQEEKSHLKNNSQQVDTEIHCMGFCNFPYWMVFLQWDLVAEIFPNGFIQ